MKQTKTKSYSTITRLICAIIIIIGLVVISGWILDIDSLKSLSPTWVTMKFSTAASFLMSGIVILLMNEYRNNNSEVSRILLFAPLIIIMFFMGTSLVSLFSDTNSGVNSLFVKDDVSAIYTLKPGLTSLGTAISFIVINVVGFTSLLVHQRYKKYVLISGVIVMIFGVVALIGYATDIPELYYQISQISGAMAVHTAIAFCLSGIALISLGISKYSEKEVKRKRGIPISAKLIFSFLVVSFIPISVIGAASYNLSQDNIERDILLNLNEQADNTLSKIELLFKERIADAQVNSNLDILKNEIKNLEMGLEDKNNPEYLASKIKVDERIKIIQSAYGYDNIAVANTNGELIYISNDDFQELMGIKMQDMHKPSFEEGKKDVYISKVFKDMGVDGKLDLFVTAPIKNSNEELLGLLMLDVPIDQVLLDTMKQTYFRNTGESFIVSYIDDEISVLHNVRLDNELVSGSILCEDYSMCELGFKAMDGMRGSGIANDYRGEGVLASWRYSSVLDWGLVSKIDVSEAYAPSNQLRQDIITLASVFIIGSAIFGVSISRLFSNPLIKLKDLASKISDGKLDTHVPVETSDEIGQLSEIMNKTVAKLKSEKEEKDNVLKALDNSTITAITDEKGTITYANKKFEDISKYTEKELLGKNHRILKSGFHPDSFFDGMWGTISKGKVWTGVVKNIAKDGSTYWVNTVITPFLDENGRPKQYMAIRMDLTKQKELEEKLAESLKKIEESQKEKEEFVAMITHDLKQPLVPIQGNAELLTMAGMGELSDMQMECVKEIQANASRQLSMIDNLVSAQKLGAGAMKYEIEELSSKNILAECIKTHSPVMTDKKIQYFESHSEDVKIKGDKRRILEAYTNLILNAHDFVPVNGKIEIGVTDGENEVTFFCKDNGEGIPKQKQDQLFKKYGQVKSDAKRKFGGTGLGLAVSQELVEGMGGKIWLESEEGKGATFFFTIPKA